MTKKDQLKVLARKETGQFWTGDEAAVPTGSDIGWTDNWEEAAVESNIRSHWTETTGNAFTTKHLAVKLLVEAIVEAEGADPAEDDEVGSPSTEVAVYEETVESVGEVVDETSLEAIMVDIRSALDAFSDARHRTVVAAWNAGAALHRAKELVGHGGWGDWLDHNFGLSQRTASDYMKVAAFSQSSADLAAEYTSISGVLKAISEARKGGRAGTPQRSLEARLGGIAKASKKLADAIEQFAADLAAEGHNADWEALTNRAVQPLEVALGDLDKLWGLA